MKKRILLSGLGLGCSLTLLWAASLVTQELFTRYSREVVSHFVQLTFQGERYPLMHAISDLRFKVFSHELKIQNRMETQACSERRNYGREVPEAQHTFCAKYDELIDLAKNAVANADTFERMYVLMEPWLLQEIERLRARKSIKLWVTRKLNCLDNQTSCGRDERQMFQRVTGWNAEIIQVYRKNMVNLVKKLFPEEQKSLLVGTTLMDSPCNATENIREITIKKGMVRIPGGLFEMGSDQGRPDEKPVHEVQLDTFWIDRCEVTNLQFLQFVADNPSLRKSTFPRQFHDGNYLNLWLDDLQPPAGKNNHPVTYVSWFAARYYCDALDKRLVSEAEWEKAVRANASSLYFFGEDPKRLGEFAWYNQNSEKLLHKVASRSPNPFELYDMLGNVWEWVYDWYSPYPELETLNPQGPTVGKYRVLRGGAWESPDHYLRVSVRGDESPVITRPEVGFRCASDTSPE
ncbi:SUMF1/EgtB/PvdO family nonheme iron enzyme [Deltaproteobacteria bacterium TL4]